ncbi:Uncharacterized protein PBTT_06532 [Plasmodiophora brassicae]
MNRALPVVLGSVWVAALVGVIGLTAYYVHKDSDQLSWATRLDSRLDLIWQRLCNGELDSNEAAQAHEGINVKRITDALKTIRKDQNIPHPDMVDSGDQNRLATILLSVSGKSEYLGIIISAARYRKALNEYMVKMVSAGSLHALWKSFEEPDRDNRRMVSNSHIGKLEETVRELTMMHYLANSWGSSDALTKRYLSWLFRVGEDRITPDMVNDLKAKVKQLEDPRDIDEWLNKLAMMRAEVNEALENKRVMAAKALENERAGNQDTSPL